MSSTQHVVTGAALAAAALGCYALYRHWRCQNHTNLDADRSTTSSAGGGAAAYETSKAVDEYLQMHYATADELFPYEDAPKNAVNFPERCALLAEQHCQALRDFTGERPPPNALDIGCAVGGATFELTKCGFGAVRGIDYSSAFINAANEMKSSGSMEYASLQEGNVTKTMIARLPEGAEPEKVSFRVGDACNLPSTLAPVDAVLAANLICRLPDPVKFLRRLPSLVKDGGVVVLTTPFSWLKAWTPEDKWLGGYTKEGKAVQSADALHEIMTGLNFQLLKSVDMPFVIREHARKYQWGCAQGTVWLKSG